MFENMTAVLSIFFSSQVISSHRLITVWLSRVQGSPSHLFLSITRVTNYSQPWGKGLVFQYTGTFVESHQVYRFYYTFVNIFLCVLFCDYSVIKWKSVFGIYILVCFVNPVRVVTIRQSYICGRCLDSVKLALPGGNNWIVPQLKLISTSTSLIPSREHGMMLCHFKVYQSKGIQC